MIIIEVRMLSWLVYIKTVLEIIIMMNSWMIFKVQTLVYWVRIINLNKYWDCLVYNKVNL